MITTAARIKSCRYGGNDDGRPGWRIAFAFDEAVITKLKSAIPASDRAWDPERKEWWVAEERQDVLRAVLPGVGVYLDQGRLL